MLDFLSLIIDTVGDFFIFFKDDTEKAWIRLLCKIGSSAVILAGLVCMIINDVLGWVLVVAGFVLLIVSDNLFRKHMKQKKT